MQSKRIVDRLIKDMFNPSLSLKNEIPVIYDYLSETALFLDFNGNDIADCATKSHCESLGILRYAGAKKEYHRKKGSSRNFSHIKKNR
jgi:hypothetical protein